MQQYTSVGGDVTIPESITKIENKAFQDCSALESIIILKEVTQIGERAFQFCSILQSVAILESVTAIREYAFFDCKAPTFPLPPFLHSKVCPREQYPFQLPVKAAFPRGWQSMVEITVEVK